MEVFRISREVFALELTASGAANRWNKTGQFVLYTGSSRSLATLELIVHRNSIVPPESYKVMVISISDSDYLVKQVLTNALPVEWRTMAAGSALQEIGGKWYVSQETLVLKVPSAIVPFEYNYLINTDHPDFKNNVQLVRTEDYFWDDRLFS